MIELKQWLAPEPLDQIIHQLADPQLSHERDREQVNQLVLNFVIKYVAEYLRAKHDDESDIRAKVEARLAVTTDDTKSLLLQMIGGIIDESIPGSHQSDLFPLQCATDLRSTAAIVKEIIFNKGFQLYPEYGFTSIDLGSGTGILAMASIVAGMRKRARSITTVALDLSEKAITESKRVMEGVIGRLRYKGEVNLVIESVDITRRGLMRVFEGMPLSFWISETIDQETPAIKATGDGVRLTSTNRMHLGMHALGAARQIDPYQMVLDRTLKDRRCFYDDVRVGRTAMFPDVINGLFLPDGQESTLLLSTSGIDRRLALPEAGTEFADYEDLGVEKRWVEGASDQENDRLARLIEDLEKEGLIKM